MTISPPTPEVVALRQFQRYHDLPRGVSPDIFKQILDERRMAYGSLLTGIEAYDLHIEYTKLWKAAYP